MGRDAVRRCPFYLVSLPGEVKKHRDMGKTSLGYYSLNAVPTLMF